MEGLIEDLRYLVDAVGNIPQLVELIGDIERKLERQREEVREAEQMEELLTDQQIINSLQQIEINIQMMNIMRGQRTP